MNTIVHAHWIQFYWSYVGPIPFWSSGLAFSSYDDICHHFVLASHPPPPPYYYVSSSAWLPHTPSTHNIYIIYIYSVEDLLLYSCLFWRWFHRIFVDSCHSMHNSPRSRASCIGHPQANKSIISLSVALQCGRPAAYLCVVPTYSTDYPPQTAASVPLKLPQLPICCARS